MRRRFAAIVVIFGTAAAVSVQAEDMARPGHPGWQAAEGSGCLVWNPGPKAGETVTWSGSCEDKKASGQGELVWYANGQVQGARYEGDLRNGEANGRGINTWPNGGRYEGEFKNGKPHGHGVEVWPGGGRYEGEYVEGKVTRGILIFASGDRWEGGFTKEPGNVTVGKLDGHGTYTFATAPASNPIQTYEGALRRGNIVGPVTIIWVTGDRYKGEIAGGSSSDGGSALKPNGGGKMTKANGDWYEGEWSGGYVDGEGTAQISGKKYKGVWARGCLRSMEQRAAWDRPRHECP